MSAGSAADQTASAPPAAPGVVPSALETQLAVSGRMIIPVGVNSQELILVRRERASFRRDNLIGVRFVPLISKDLDRDNG